MGCDGGTIPRRDELVRTKKKPEQKDKDSELSFRWQHCSITQQPLQSPIVACGLGRLYNKDAVLELLLDKSIQKEGTQHINNLKDIKELQLTSNAAYKRCAEKGDAYIDRRAAPYICPVIGLEMNGKFRFVFLWRCGCVVSERALKAVKTKLCHKCQQPFLEEDVVVLNGTEEDQDLMQVRLESRQAQLKADKKARSDAKRKIASEDKSPQIITLSSDEPTSSKMSVKISVDIKINGSKSEKRPASGEIQDPVFKRTKGSYSVAKDPRATEVYKSLFTSHRKAHEQTKAHWVTYNPFYN